MDASRERLESLVRVCGRRAWTVAWSLLRDGHAAHDAVQQAFLVAARKHQRVPRDDPWPWFAAVVVGEARNMRRKRRPIPIALPEADAAMIPPKSTAADPSLLSEQRDDARRVHTALEALPAEQRDAVALVQLGGMSHAAAAEALGVSRQTIGVRVQQGLDALGRDLGRQPASVAGALALVPLAAPPLGWETALATWTQTAVSSLAGATAATTALGGMTLMSSKTLLALTLTAAMGVGFLGGHVATTYYSDGGPDASRANVALAPQGADAPGSGSPSLDPGTRRVGAEMERLHREGADLRAKLDEARALNEALEKRLASSKASSGPTFTFGQVGALPAIREANWGEMAQASAVVTDSIHTILTKKEAGEAIDKSVYLALQENVERMRKYEYRTIGKMPTAAKHNGEYTHPITIANLFAAMLEGAGHPLSQDQVARIEALGLRFEREFAAQRARESEQTPRVARMVAEYELKGRFTQELAGVLDAEQRAVVYDEETRGIAGLDLHDPTLMIIHTSPVLVGSDLDEITTKLTGVLRKKLGLDEESATLLERPLDAWKHDVRTLLEAVPATRVKHYSYAQGSTAGHATVRLVSRLLGELDLTAEVRKALLDDFAIYVPRVVTKPS